MSNADLYILEDAIKSVEVKVSRDFNELEHLQSSNKTIAFTNATLQYMKEKFYTFFKNKRPNYSLNIKDYKEEIIESEYKIYVNCIAGVKNFSHSIPYFATIMSIKKNDKVIAAVVNNYAEKEMFNCAVGENCFMNTSKIRVSSKNTLSDSLIAIKYSNDKEQFTKIANSLPFFKVNNCYALDFCYVAWGKYDGCVIINGIKEELEIGELFVRESGGLIYYLNEEKTSCIFSNSLIFDELKKLIN